MCKVLTCKMNLKGIFQEFNPSKFLVYVSTLIFVVLLGLRLDNLLPWSYFIVFLPLWIWKALVFAGAGMGTFVWIRHPEYRRENNVDLQAMLVAAGFHMLLLLFEIMLSLNMENYHAPYRLVFIPLFCMSAFAIAGCIWGFRHERQLELETFFSVNILQFICLALRLDDVIDWNWVVVFVPVWIILTLLSVVVLYYIVWAMLFMRSPDITRTQRKAHLVHAIISFLMVIPLLSFMVMLSRKLDRDSDAYYSTVFVPLELSLLSLTIASFYQKGGNQWWFGMRKDFCDFLLETLPCLREYGNLSCTFADALAADANSDDSNSLTSDSSTQHRKVENRTVVPVVYIEVPD